MKKQLSLSAVHCDSMFSLLNILSPEISGDLWTTCAMKLASANDFKCIVKTVHIVVSNRFTLRISLLSAFVVSVFLSVSIILLHERTQLAYLAASQIGRRQRY